MAQTFLTDLINPEVMSDYLNTKMIDYIRLAPLANINTELVGNAGDTLTIPKYGYIGTAATIAEGGSITSAKLTATTTTVTVKKIVKNVDISDEALLSAYGDPVAEIERQFSQSLGEVVETDLYTSLEAISATRELDFSEDNESGGTALTPAPISKEAISSAQISLFGEDYDEETYLVVSPYQFGQLRLDSDFIHVDGGSGVVSGLRGQIYGVNVIVSNRIVENDATTTADSKYFVNYFIKPNAMEILLKRDTVIETDRNITTKESTISADRHYATYIKDESKVGKVFWNKA